MKRKNLEKIIVLGLLLSSSMYGTAWADFTIDKQTNTLIGNENLANYQQDEYELSSFDNIRIDIDSKNQVYGWGKQGGRLNIPTTNLEIIINSNRSYSDGVRLFGWETEFEVNDYHVEVYAPNSDGLNLDHGGTPKKVQINGDFTAIIQDGSAVRANSSTFEKNGLSQMNTINIEGNADITLLENSSAKSTAIWAGDSQKYYYLEFLDRWMGSETKGQGTINLNGDNTNIALKGDGNYGIWAGRNGTINVNSNVEILATSNNSYGIAATNGNISYSDSLDVSLNRWGSTVTLNGDTNKIYMVETDENGNIKLDENGNPVQTEGSKAIYADSQYGVVQSGANGIGNIDIVGDMVADDSGEINLEIRDWADITGDIEATNNATIDLSIKEDASDISVMSNTPKAINIIGNVQAANGATIDLSLGDGATFTGRVDDYIDAANKELWNKIDHNSLFDEDFVKDNKVASSGSVNLTLGNGSEWDVTAQSWVTKIDAENSIIDLTKGGSGNHAVHIGDLNGNATFVVNLDPDTEADVNNGNMIYVYNGEDAKNLNLRINNETEVLTSLADGEKLRFATVAEKGGGFGDTYVARGRGVINSGFSIKYEKYETDNNKENDRYNGGEDFDASKPGSNYVDSIYGVFEDSENVYLVRDTSKDAGKSDSGETIINMSRANYKNAIYMDRLNKRMGEMRYVDGEEEQGLWVRLRHDRIGQSGDFRSMNTMYELGYDVKQPASSGEHRIGMAIDYMDGSTTYDDILGKGETKRYGLWLYDTWLGEKGHYTDYIVKWGHLSNEFDIRDKDSFEHIVGDYSNNVFSVSAEYGKKNDMGNNWYFEPQAQLQLARVTGADYVTTQGSKVSVDGINSLIGRAGFRIGRDMNENSTVYLKADLLHEFMGDQTVTAADATGTLREEFDNKGTWYDVGFGFAAKMSKNSYAFLDFERSFGNDNDETYQINAGLQWSF